MQKNQNRVQNARNNNQGSAKKVLCVCSAGLLRSPTAAVVLAQEYGYNTRAVGIIEDYALIVLDNVLIAWADEIVFMDEHHYRNAQFLFDKFPWDKIKTRVLDIPDCYGYMQPELQEAILNKYKNG